MKCAVLQIRGKSDQVEAELNGWLAARPTIKIHAVTVSAGAGFTYTIFYEE